MEYAFFVHVPEYPAGFGCHPMRSFRSFLRLFFIFPLPFSTLYPSFPSFLLPHGAEDRLFRTEYRPTRRLGFRHCRSRLRDRPLRRSVSLFLTSSPSSARITPHFDTFCIAHGHSRCRQPHTRLAFPRLRYLSYQLVVHGPSPLWTASHVLSVFMSLCIPPLQWMDLVSVTSLSPPLSITYPSSRRSGRSKQPRPTSFISILSLERNYSCPFSVF